MHGRVLSILSILLKATSENNPVSYHFFEISGFGLFFPPKLEENWNVLVILYNRIDQKFPIFKFEGPRF